MTDPAHALFGLRLAVASPASSRGPGWVAVLLPDGRRRHLPLGATSLGGERPATAGVGVVSARTLLPAAALAQALSARRREEARDGDDTWGPVAGPCPPAVAGDAPGPAPAAGRGPGGDGGARGRDGQGGGR